MEQLVRVRQIFADGTAEVLRVRESACSGDCHQCAGCGAPQQSLLFQAENPIGAKPGELVTVESDSGTVLAAAAAVYLAPVALFFLGYLAGELLLSRGAWVGCAAFLAGIALAVVYDRRTAKKRPARYKITGYPTAAALETQIKGDNDLD